MVYTGWGLHTPLSWNSLGGGGEGGGMFYHDSGCSELRQCAVLQKGLNSPVCGWARLMQVLLRLVEGSGSTPVGVC